MNSSKMGEFKWKPNFSIKKCIEKKRIKKIKEKPFYFPSK